MNSKRFAATLLFVSLITAVLLLSPRGNAHGNEGATLSFLPAVVNLKAMLPYRVADVNNATPSSFIYCPAFKGNYLLCSARDDEHGYEYWRSNGEKEGAMMIMDIAPGLYDSYAFSSQSPTLGNIVLFTADTGSFGLWKTDATTAGTELVKGPFLSFAGEEPFTAVGNQVFFVADDGVHGSELWRSDGNTAGTYLVKELNAGIYTPTPLGDLLYFIAEGENYNELWRSDGTKAGTKRIEAVAYAPINQIGPLDDFLLLDMHDVLFEPPSLYRTDGTPEGTLLLTDYGTYHGLYVQEFAELDSAAVFTFLYDGYSRWGIGRSDGTGPGTNVFSVANKDGRSPRNLTAAGTQAFFIEENLPDEMEALWRTDGTAEGTRKLLTFKRADDTFCRENFYVVGSTLYFVADDGVHGCELWLSDGTAEGTRLVADIAPGAKSSYPRPGVFFKQRLYFSATSVQDDAELWRTDGTAEGTLLADDVLDRPSQSSNPHHLTAEARGIYFSARTGRETGLWHSDGTLGGTRLVRSFGSGTIDDPLASAEWVMAGDKLYLLTQLPEKVWRSDGTTEGTVQLSGPVECDSPYLLAAVGERAYFFASARGNWLCRAGTPHEKIKFLGGDRVRDVATGGGLLYFSAGSKIGVSDGTEAGTRIFTGSNVAFNTRYMAAVGDTLYFSGCDAAAGCELWKVRGTQGPPVRVLDIEPGPSSSNPSKLFAVYNTLIFTAELYPYGRLLWRSNGAAENTLPIAQVDMCQEPDFGSITGTVVGAFFFFPGIGPGAGSGCELWASNGTSTGTALVKDIVVGPNHSFPGDLTAAGSYLVFTADDGMRGRELWASDGSAQGTFLLADIKPQTGEPLNRCNYGSCPDGLTVSNGKLFFGAYDQWNDNELWAMLIYDAPEATTDQTSRRQKSSAGNWE